MPLNCDVLVDSDLQIDAPQRFADLLQHAALTDTRLNQHEWQMTLRLSSDVVIAALHEEFFGDPSPTDVITFPSGEQPSPDNAYLGDVIVSIETACVQAVEAGHSTSREVAFLALHGLLHLCGYNDDSDVDRKAMLCLQVALLNSWEAQTRLRL